MAVRLFLRKVNRMKIGAFAEKYHVSRDTIRFYVKRGLLTPKLAGCQLEFAQQEDADMKRILKMKNMQLSLGEIQDIFYLRRMSNFIEPSTLHHCIDLLENKQKEVMAEKERMEQGLILLGQEIKKLKEKLKEPGACIRSGVPLTAFSLLCCPKCGASLKIRQAEIENGYIMNGEISCACSWHASIRDGIVITGNVYMGKYDTPDMERKLYHENTPEYNTCALKGPEYILEQLDRENLKGKVVLEANINGFFFVYNFLSRLSHDCTYVFVDKYPEVLAMYKKLIESLYDDLDILYIADAGENFPLQKNSLDYVVALFGENEYSFYHKNTQLHDIAALMKPGAKAIGAYQSMKWDCRTRKNLQKKYPEGNYRMCNMGMFQKEYAQNGFFMQHQLLGTVMKTLKHHMYTEHIDGEPIEIYGYVACKQ